MSDSENKTVTKKDAVALLWKKGILWWKLNDTQKDLYDTVLNADKRIIVFLASRRIGKTHTLCTIALEQCIKKKNSVVKYLCPDAKQAKSFVIPIIREILEDCPKALRPEYIKSDGKYVFPNGSELQIAGNDAGRAESLRGGFADLCIVDEAGFCDNLKYNVQSILFPTVSTTGGKIVLSSTPPATPGHEFTFFINKAKADNTFVKKTIYDNPRFTPAQIEEIISTYGSITDTQFRREYLCELITNDQDAVFPEFNAELKSKIVMPWERPTFFDYYVAADIGFKDFTVVLFGYFDFRNNKLIIEDEIVINKMTTQTLADTIKKKEEALLTHPLTNELQVPFLRVSDTNLIVINDLQKLHGINFLPTAKDNKEAAINNTRILLESEQIIINPRCVTLIRHCEDGTWKKNSTGKTRTFDRSADNGHYDALDALIYMVRNVNFSRNPYPKGYGQTGRDHRFNYNNTQEVKPVYRQIANIFKIKKSL